MRSESSEKLSLWQTYTIGLWNEKVSNTGWLEGGMKVQRGNFKLSKAGGIQSQCRPEDENHSNFSGALRNCLSKSCCCKIHNLKALPTYCRLNWVNKYHFFLCLTMSVFFFSRLYQGSIESLVIQNRSVYHKQNHFPISFSPVYYFLLL